MVQKIMLFSGIGLILASYGVGWWKRRQLRKSWSDFRESIEDSEKK